MFAWRPKRFKASFSRSSQSVRLSQHPPVLAPAIALTVAFVGGWGAHAIYAEKETGSTDGIAARLIESPQMVVQAALDAGAYAVHVAGAATQLISSLLSWIL